MVAYILKYPKSSYQPSMQVFLSLERLLTSQKIDSKHFIRLYSQF